MIVTEIDPKTGQMVAPLAVLSMTQRELQTLRYWIAVTRSYVGIGQPDEGLVDYILSHIREYHETEQV